MKITKTQAIAQAIEELGTEDISAVRNRALSILSAAVPVSYDSLSAKRVQMHMKPLFKEQHSVLKELSESSAAEFIGYEVWRLFKTQRERDAVTIAYNKIRERITRGFN